MYWYKDGKSVLNAHVKQRSSVHSLVFNFLLENQLIIWLHEVLIDGKLFSHFALHPV